MQINQRFAAECPSILVIARGAKRVGMRSVDRA